MSTSDESKQVESSQDGLPLSAILGICLFAYFLLIIAIMIARQFILARGYLNFGNCQKCCASICCPSFDQFPCRCTTCLPFTECHLRCSTIFQKAVSNAAWLLTLPYTKAAQQNVKFSWRQKLDTNL
ncbi:hypothetical protein M514_04939 [Trichuris suis]|uniref:Uncharacterized protein n=1 Tax=Trichuris suis TaxID=68888 RepID=A0A085MAB6_9BILA|nr:hypothetical protein M513_04939 [Trichuris suis]KFD71216.1 hypothetical protein M514_04939 [Trichuris suis]